MLNAVSLSPIHVPLQAEEAAALEQQPTTIDAHASRAHRSTGETPPAPPVPPWLEPNNFEFLRRVAHAVMAGRDSGNGQ